ncbi:MAG TPA: dihydrolipoamide acetyltransferase family protein [Mycobacteriales bacterium]|nr:dihydrolipoamide acetyltransferase family protein [Mycobacteriales bacterium]
MPTFKQFTLPDLGEGLTEGEILKWLVAPGDEVKLNQPIVEVETAKAAVEVPSPFAGVVTELHHAEGATVDVGSPLISFDVDPGGPAASGGRPEELVPEIAVPADDQAVEPGLIGGSAPGGRTSVLVGYGPRQTSAKRRARKDSTAAPIPPARVSAAAVGELAAERAAATVLAKPPVRKLARDLGVDLRGLTGSGPAGSITRTDVEAAATPGSAGRPADPQFDPASREQRIPIRGVRKATAEAMVASAFTAPHVTEFLTVDVTAGMELLDRLRALPDFVETKISPLLLVAKALLVAVRRHPMINASWDAAAGEIVVRDYVNLGIAAATPRGLLVPNVKDAGRLSLPELAVALGTLTRTAREGKTTPADMQRGTITITNVGVFGVDTGTPILNPGEAAILCVGAIRPTPWVHAGAIAIRQVTQLGLSFDHRLVDGKLGSEFLADLGRMLEDPALIVAFG